MAENEIAELLKQILGRLERIESGQVTSDARDEALEKQFDVFQFATDAPFDMPEKRFEAFKVRFDYLEKLVIEERLDSIETKIDQMIDKMAAFKEQLSVLATEMLEMKADQRRLTTRISEVEKAAQSKNHQRLTPIAPRASIE